MYVRQTDGLTLQLQHLSEECDSSSFMQYAKQGEQVRSVALSPYAHDKKQGVCLSVMHTRLHASSSPTPDSHGHVVESG